jgi:glycosyltransferase involved in cell wall biosynthesis
MKILQIHNFYRTPGGECSVVRAERALLESHGHEVAPYYRDSGEIDRWNSFAKARMLLDVPYSRTVEGHLAAAIRAIRPDVAHVHNVFPLLTPAVYRTLKRCGIPVVQTVHNFRFLCPNGQFFVHQHICEACQKHGYISAVVNRCMQNNVIVSAAYAAAVARSWRKKILPQSIDAYIVLNEFFSERLINAGVPRERIHLLSNYVPSCLGSVPPKQGYTLYLGRLSREKGVLTLLDAWRRIEGGRLIIAGSGPLAEEIRVLAKQFPDNRVEVVGHVDGDAKRELLKGAMCAFAPSEWYENFPISAIEAMAHGTPVLASRIGGLPEIVVDNVSGLLFESGNAASLASTAQRLLSEPGLMERLAGGALAQAQRLYGPEAHYEGMITIYEGVVRESVPLAQSAT